MIWAFGLTALALVIVGYGMHRHEPRWMLLALFVLIGAAYWVFQP